MKAIYSAVVLIAAVILFAWTKGSPLTKPTTHDFLSGTWYGQCISHSDSSRRKANIEASLGVSNETMSGAWYCGADGGTFAAANPELSPQRGKRVRQ